jgi:hypothetical protein
VKATFAYNPTAVTAIRSNQKLEKVKMVEMKASTIANVEEMKTATTPGQ